MVSMGLSRIIIASVAWCSTIALAQHGHIKGTLKVDGSVGGRVTPSAPALLTMSYIDHTTHTPMTKFEKLHGKSMHMILVSRDLSHFSHIHPYLTEDSGEFNLMVNTENDDPDNQDTAHAISIPGEHLLFTEIFPQGAEMPETVIFKVNDEAEIPLPAPKADISYPQKNTILYYKTDGTQGDVGDYYRINFSYDQMFICTSWFPRFFAEVYKLENGSYIKATNFEPILEIGGHAILVSYEGEGNMKKFHHFHAFLPEDGDNVLVFPFHNHKMTFDDAVYKMWIQFKHEGNRVTLPLVIDYKNPPIPKGPTLKCSAP
ncbi:MAG: hypothetical protein AB7T49_19010 [Oligoflexales bacterium]